jgi:hypothetical protein
MHRYTTNLLSQTGRLYFDKEYSFLTYNHLRLVARIINADFDDWCRSDIGTATKNARTGNKQADDQYR